MTAPRSRRDIWYRSDRRRARPEEQAHLPPGAKTAPRAARSTRVRTHPRFRTNDENPEMPRKARRARLAPRVEALEGRALLSAGDNPLPTADLPVDSTRSLLVRLNDSVAPTTAVALYGALGASILRDYADGPTVIELPTTAARNRVVAYLDQQPWVTYAEADGPVRTQAQPTTTTTPNDPDFSQLWGLQNTSTGVDISATAAWAAAGGGAGVIVAVLDTGIDTDPARPRRPALDQPRRGRRQRRRRRQGRLTSTTSTAGTSSTTPPTSPTTTTTGPTSPARSPPTPTTGSASSGSPTPRRSCR